MSVFVLDKKKNPLMPCSEKRARLLLQRGRAVVIRVYPFTIRLKDRVGGETQDLRLGIDPRSKTTGLMLARECEKIDSESGEIKRTRLTARGFPRGYLLRKKSVNGFQTGDMVIADIPKGVKSGVHVGRVAIRSSGYFNIQSTKNVIQGVSHRHCKMMQRADGYGYSIVAQQKEVSGNLGHASRAALSIPGMNAEVSRAI